MMLHPSVSACITFITGLTNVFYIQIYIDIYVPVSLGGHNFYARKLKFGKLISFHISLGGHNFGIFYARKLKFGMLL